MTDLAMNYVVNPTGSFFKNLWTAFVYGMELRGMVRAAQELERMGYTSEAREIMQRARNHKRM